MDAVFDLTYCDLRCKEIINFADGKRLGRILDMVFTSRGEIRGIVAPFGRKGFLLKSQEIFIPWKCIKKIGEDVILVEISDPFPRGQHRTSKEKGLRSHDFCYDRDCDPAFRPANRTAAYTDFGCDADCSSPHECDQRHDVRHGSPHECDQRHDVRHGSPHECDQRHDTRHGNPHECDQRHDTRHGNPHDHGQRHNANHGGQPKKRESSQGPECDRRCEKCMLFDCVHRWDGGEGIFVDDEKYK